MKSNDNYDCFCCCCCCHGNSNLMDIPPWLPSSTTHMDSSMCSCCSSCCESSSSIIQPITQEKVIISIDDNAGDKKARRKLHAIQELLLTERDYVQDLSYLVQVCLQVLSRQSWITQQHVSIIKRNSNEILSFHKQFIISFEQEESFIAKAFINQIEQFSLYKHYCDMHAEAWTLISEYRDRPEWQIFLKDCYSLSQQQNKLQFEDYLIKPVQRICRYQLLIKEIIKYTFPQTSEYDLWTIVLREMQDIVSEIDNRKFQHDMKERTDKFISRLDDEDWRISKKYVSQLGNLLIAGAIEVTYSALGQSIKSRYLGCFIFKTWIIIVRPKKVTNYEPKHWFPLKMTDFEDLIDIQGQREHSFILRCKKHTFSFSASCWQEKQLWTKKIQEAIIVAAIDDDDCSIVSSLTGITTTTTKGIRLSKSFIEMRSHHHHENLSIKRSASTSMNQFVTLPPPPVPPPLPPLLKKRYSADYATTRHNNSDEMFNITHKRPSSLDLLSNNNSMIGKMSLHLKSNHQNALRMTVDHKIRDVCTQEYLSSRAWYIRDRDASLTVESTGDLQSHKLFIIPKRATKTSESAASESTTSSLETTSKTRPFSSSRSSSSFEESAIIIEKSSSKRQLFVVGLKRIASTLHMSSLSFDPQVSDHCRSPVSTPVALLLPKSPPIDLLSPNSKKKWKSLIRRPTSFFKRVG